MTAAPIPITAGFMVVVFVGSMLARRGAAVPDVLQCRRRTCEAFAGGCGLADDVLVEPDANAGFLTPLPGNYGPLGPLGGVGPVGFTPNGVPDHIVAEAIRNDLPTPGTDYDWDAPVKLTDARASTARPCRCPTASTRKRVPLAGTLRRTAPRSSRAG